LREALQHFLVCKGSTSPELASKYLWELADDVAVGALPTVNGILLGYPWTYCVTAENVNHVASQLSTSLLKVFR
jgi:hypothetical protein